MSDLVVYVSRPTEKHVVSILRPTVRVHVEEYSDLEIVSFLDGVLIDLERISCRRWTNLESLFGERISHRFPREVSKYIFVVNGGVLTDDGVLTDGGVLTDFCTSDKATLEKKYGREVRRIMGFLTYQDVEIGTRMLPNLKLGGRFCASKDDRLRQIVKAGTWTEEAETLGICAIKIFSFPPELVERLMAESVFQTETPAAPLGAKDKKVVIEALGILREHKLF